MKSNGSSSSLGETDSKNYRDIKEIYKVTKTLGQGQQTKVKKGKHRETKQEVAIKVLSKKKITEKEQSYLQEELAILKSLDHPNIVKFIDFFEDDSHFCIVMELLQGGALFDSIIEQQKNVSNSFSEPEVRDAIMSLADAMAYYHNMGVVHRDIKPENILLQSKEQGITSLKIADFGIAKKLEDDQMASSLCGTPAYVAPEVLDRKPYGMECDCWSIGIIAYILLSGNHPFNCSDQTKLFNEIKNCEYNFDDQEWANISDDAKDFISKILVADPKQRLTAAQMMEHPWMKASF